MSLYTDACHVVATYEDQVIEFTKPTFQNKLNWYDEYFSVFQRVATDPIKWSNQIVPQLISIPQHLIDASAGVASHFNNAADDFSDLARHPNEQTSIDDALSQLRSILSVITTASNSCLNLLANLDQYVGMTAQIDAGVLLQGVNLANGQLAENYREMEFLREDIGHLQDYIDSLSKLPFFGAQEKIREAREKIAYDEQLYGPLQHDVGVLQGMSDALNSIHQQNQQVVANFGPIRDQWMEFMNLVEKGQFPLNLMIASVSQNPALAAQEMEMAKNFWNEILSASRDLAAISYS